MKRCLADLEAGLADTLVIPDLARLSRSIRDFLHIQEKLVSLDVNLVCLNPEIDFGSAFGETFAKLIVILAEFERKLIAERMLANLRARAEQGLFNGGSYPLGLGPNPQDRGRPVVVAEESEIANEVLRAYVEAGLLSKAAKVCQERGYRTKAPINGRKSEHSRGGKLMTTNDVFQLVTNRSVIGEREINKKNKNKDPLDLPDHK